MTRPVPITTMSGNLDFPPASSTPSQDPGASRNLPPSLPSSRPTMSGIPTGSVTDSPEMRRLQALRENLRSERRREVRRRRNLDEPSPQPTPATANSPSERRRLRAISRSIATLSGSQTPGSVSDRTTPQTSTPSGPGSGSLLPPPPSEVYLRGGPPASRSGNLRAEALADLQQAGARLAEASSDLRSLLEDPVRLSVPDLAAIEYSGEAEVNRLLKRRKLNSGATDHGFPKVKYGYYGQVEPGSLKMEIVSCDGGNYPNAEGKDRAYWAENVLRDDKSVYCTKIGKCNLLLRHQGETAFTLKSIVIKAPKSDFTAPVQEGMVFVSMTSEDLLERTQPYQMLYPPPTTGLPPAPRGDPPTYTQDSAVYGGAPREEEWMNGPTTVGRQALERIQPPPPTRGGRFLWHPWSSRSRQASRTATTTTRPESAARASVSTPSRNSAAQEHFGDDDDDDDDDEACDELNPSVTIASHLPTTAQPFTVTTDQSSDEDDSPDGSDHRAATLRRRREILALANFSPSSGGYTLEPDDDHRTAAEILEDSFGLVGLDAEHLLPLVGQTLESHRMPKMPTRLARPNEISWTKTDSLSPFGSHRLRADAQGAAVNSGSVRSSGEEEAVLAPHARFFIKKDKDRCALEFDPPVSGKFILLKLFSPSPDENIDIQSVVAYGFAGPRLFPARDLQ